MKKAKYQIYSDKGIMVSNSRNARKHLIDLGAVYVHVYANTTDLPLLCVAEVSNCGCILVGAVKKDK